MSTKGQIVIPADMREAMKLEPGTRVALEIEGDALLLRPVTAEFVRSLRGITRGKGLSALREWEHRKDRM
jgi:AbrB family looped-hinge helix DNA binding protein